jgi:hypothetical protein
MGILTQSEMQDLEDNLCNENNIKNYQIIVKKGKTCCEIAGHTIAAIIIYSVNILIEVIDSIFYYMLATFLQIRDGYLRVDR